MFPFLEVIMSGKDFVSKGTTIFLMCNATGEDYAFISGLSHYSYVPPGLSNLRSSGIIFAVLWDNVLK
jgi:hypothetical protein